MTFSMPMLITTSVYLNAIVRGAEKAVERLGDDYFLAVSKDYSCSNVDVRRRGSKGGSDFLNPLQSIVSPEELIWHLRLNPTDLRHSSRDAPQFFKENPPKYFFLSIEEAQAYVTSIEEAAAEAIIAKTNSKAAS